MQLFGVSTHLATETSERRRTALACVLLVLAVLAIYAPVYYYDFLNYDDGDYVVLNSQVNGGISKAGLIWAWANLHGEHTYWHPLTWVSHMLDCQLFGLNPGPHHLVNVLFHAVNSILLFLVLKRMTGAFGRSALVAGLFALHPLQVDTVAWVTERKSLLSTLFWLLTMWAYVRYAEGRRKKAVVSNQLSVISNQSDGSRNTQHATGKPPRSAVPSSTFGVQRSMFDVRLSPPSLFYFLSLFSFALGLTAKPALVTLPFVLLLLDYWPLRRLQLPWLKVRCSRLDVGCSQPVGDQSLLASAAAKPLSVWRLLWEKLPFLALAAAASFVTVAAHQQLHSFNRLALPLDWRIANAVVSYVRYLGKAFWPAHLAVFYPCPGVWAEEVVAGSGLVLLALSALVIWRARVAPYLVTGWLWFLGVLVPMIGIIQAGDQAMADRFAYVPLIGLFIMIVWAVGDWAGRWPQRSAGGISRYGGLTGLLVLGACALATSRQLPYWQNTVTLFEHALAVTSDNATARVVLGNGLQSQGRNERALSEYRAATALVPSTPKANYNLALLLQAKGEWQEAAEQYEIAILGNPEQPDAHFYLAEALQHLGRTREAVFHLREALRFDPDSMAALNNLAWVLASSNDPDIRNGAEAVRLAERACERTKYQVTLFVGTLAAAYAEAGRFAEAVATAQKACDMASKAKDPELFRRNQELLELYRARQPYREPATPAPTGGDSPAIRPAGTPSNVTTLELRVPNAWRCFHDAPQADIGSL